MTIVEDEDVPCRLLMSGDLVGRMIGKGGTSIKQIREISEAQVAVLEKETPAALIALNERIVRISGSTEAKDIALRLILHKVKEFTLNEMTGQKIEDWIDLSSVDPLAGVNDDIPTNLYILVPDSACSNIIGTKGETLKRLSDESGASIQVSREPVVGYPGQRRIQLCGNITNVRCATQMIHAIMVDMANSGSIKTKHFELPGIPPNSSCMQGSGFSSQSPNPMTSVLNPSAAPFTSQFQQSGPFSFGNAAAMYAPMAMPSIMNTMTTMGPTGEAMLPIRILVNKDEAAWVVGRKGVKVQKLREEGQVNVNIDEAGSPPFQETDRLITINGPTAAKHSAFIYILSDLEKHPASNDTLRLLIPADSFGIVMGKKGEQMKKITIATCANIQKMEPGSDGIFSFGKHFPEDSNENALDDGAPGLSQQTEHTDKVRRSKTVVTLGGRDAPDQTQYRLLVISGNDKQRTQAALMIVQLLDQRVSDDSHAIRHDNASQLVHATNQAMMQTASSTGISMSGNEAVLMQLAASTGTTTQRPVRMQILIPSHPHLAFLMGPGGQGADLNTIGKRAGCEIQLGGTVPDAVGNTSGFPVLILSGSAVGNAFAFLLIQERLLTMETGNVNPHLGANISSASSTTCPVHPPPREYKGFRCKG